MTANPLVNPEAWDVCSLGGVDLPGLCVECAGASNPRKWEERAGYGQSGATVVYTGDGLAKFPITLHFWLPEHFDQWEAIKGDLMPKMQRPAPFSPPPATKASDIAHPSPDYLPMPISAVVVEEVAVPKQVEPGLFEITIKVIQYRKPTGAGAVPDGAKDKPADKPDAADQMIKDLTDQIGKLAA